MSTCKKDAFGFSQPANASAGTMQVKGVALTHTNSVTRSDIVAARRRGLAFETRSEGWTWLSEATKKRQASPLAYHQLAACSDRVPDETLYAIEEDCRTIYSFRQNSMFASSRGAGALHSLLMAYAQSGYVRLHTARLAAMMLVVYGIKNLEDAFWAFCALVEDRMFNYCDAQMVLGSQVEQRVLERLVAKKLPAIASHLAKMRLPLANLTHGWFSSCFVSVLPAETAARVLDSVMAEGNKVMQRVALALLQRHEAAIISCSRSDCLRKVLEARITRVVEVDDLMQTAFTGIGSLPGNLLKSFRDPECLAIAAEITDAKERLEIYSLSRIVSLGLSTSGRSTSSSARSE